MNNGLFRFADIFYKLVATNFYIARQQLFNQFINLCIWGFCQLVVMGYLMQSFGLASSFGAFQLATVIGTVGLFEVYGNTVKSIMDFEGDRSIGYYLTLPASSTVVLLSMVCSYALVGILLSCAMFLFNALIFSTSFNIANISCIKFAVIIVLANIFYGVFTIAVTAHVGSMAKIRNAWSRFIFPLWFMGGFQFSWASMYKLSAPLAYALLCNPIIFIMEGVRAALLGAEGCLPWEVCCIALCSFTIVLWFYAHYKMKKLLDFV
ncbi:MAG TPA: hypothetical protein VLB80_04635 [Candidatus Babeliales bacterium]|nr:hypothetical protein [Candidatus Babeliales bacterium]